MNDVFLKINKILLSKIEEAQYEAFCENIKANMIVINERLCKTKEFTLSCGNQIALFPKMILGMKVNIAKKELPEDVDFAIFESNGIKDFQKENEELKDYIKMLKGTIKGLERNYQRFRKEINK